MVFDGVELINYNINSIRKQVDFISVIYQTTSYFGNKSNSNQFDILKNTKADKIIHVEPDLNVHHKINELNYRNLGLSLSREAGCTHHISFDVDEFCMPKQLEYAKQTFGDNDCSIIRNDYYYKKPEYLIVPDQELIVTFIHPVDNEYFVSQDPKFKKIETTRRHKNSNKIRLYEKNEITLHHMSYVRNNIRQKLENSDNGRFYNIDKFVDDFNKYQLGDRLRIVPDFMNRKTTLVENFFNIKIQEEICQQPA